MEQHHANNSSQIPHDTDLRNDADGFRTIPNASEPFGKVPHASETFRSVPKGAERKENHTLTVREASRMFETAGVARTERSIVNWCQLNGQGLARLDAYFDPNERKYFITPQSVELAIAEEKAKAAKVNEPSEPFGNVRKDAETRNRRNDTETKGGSERLNDLEKELVDLKIVNKAKDYFIDQLQKEREGFSIERQGYVEKLMSFNHRVGELETQLLQLEGPASNKARRLQVRPDESTSGIEMLES